MSLSSLSLASSLLVLLVLPACGSDTTSTPPAPSTDPTFTRVTQEVLTNGHCGGPLCHSSGVAAFKLGSKTTIYDSLINMPATGVKCRPDAVEGGTQNFVLVVPDKPDESLLYMKIDHNPPCGDAMPVGLTLKDDQIKLVHDWIAAGAKND